MVSAVHPEANPYGPTVPPEEAPSAITQAVASLPPEQMFELMKQMKVLCTNSVDDISSQTEWNLQANPQ